MHHHSSATNPIPLHQHFPQPPQQPSHSNQNVNNIFTFNLFQPKVFPIACTACRLSHRKCSKTLPICDQCSSRGIACLYQDRKKRASKRPESDSSENSSSLAGNSSSNDRDSSNSPDGFQLPQHTISLQQQQQLLQIQYNNVLSPSSTENSLHRLHDRVNFFASVFFDHLSTITYPSFISKEKLLRLLLADQQLQQQNHYQRLALQHVPLQKQSSPPPFNLSDSEYAVVYSIEALCLQAAGYKTEAQDVFSKAEDIVNDFWFNRLCGHSNDVSLAVDAENIMCCMAIFSLFYGGSGFGEKSMLYQDMYQSLLQVHKKYFANNPDIKKLNPDFWEGILFFDRIHLLATYSKVDYVNKVRLYKQLKILIFRVTEEQLRAAREKETKLPTETFSYGKLEVMVPPPDRLADIQCFDLAIQIPYDSQSYASEHAAMDAVETLDRAGSEMFMSFNQVITYGPFSETDIISSDMLRFTGVVYFYSLKVQGFWTMRQRFMTLGPQFSSVLLHTRKLIIQNAGDIASLCRHSKLLGMTPYQTTTELKLSFEILLQEFDLSRKIGDGLIDPIQLDTWIGYVLSGFEIFAHRYDSTMLEFGGFINHLRICKKNLQILVLPS